MPTPDEAADAAPAVAQQRRDLERAEEIRKFISVCSGRLALPLFLAFWLVDLVYAPENKWESLCLRCLMIPVCLLTNRAMRTWAATLRQAQGVGLAFVAANSAIITAIMLMTPSQVAGLYYAGLNLVGFGILTFVPFDRAHLVAASSLTYLPLVAAAVVTGTPSTAPAILTNLSFVVATVTISLVVRRFTEDLRRRETEHRVQLEHEVASRDRVIEQRTDEAVRLKALSRHFSPQVARAIQSGQIDVAGSHRREICVLFIDVVNSTDRILATPAARVQRVVDTFLECATSALLLHDLTVDKFTGDGIIAFSNAPFPRADFIQRVADAAMEVQAQIARRQDYFREQWPEGVQLRTGIAKGMADVRFYGHENMHRTYTAIGPVMNLAARLQAAAQPDQILISAEVAAHLNRVGGYVVSPCGDRSLKGFEGAVRVFELRRTEGDVAAAATDIPVCPQGHGVLHLETEDNLFFFQCRECGHRAESAGERRGASNPGGVHRTAAGGSR